MRIPSTAGTRDPERSRFFHKLSDKPTEIAFLNPIKLIIVAAFIAIVFSLGLALWSLMHDKGNSDRTVKALTTRVILSIGLFVFLMIAFATGLIKPHGF